MQEKLQKCVLKKQAMAIQVIKIVCNATLPTRGLRLEVGHKLYTLEDLLILA